MNRDIRDLHEVLLDIMGILNEPQRDAALIALDRALFPLLVRIERKGPIGVVELADISGRDYTTVSRQIAALEKLGLVAREIDDADRRVRKAAITPKGEAMTKAIDKAREAMIGPKLARWSKPDRQNLIRLLRKLVTDARAS